MRRLNEIFGFAKTSYFETVGGMEFDLKIKPVLFGVERVGPQGVGVVRLSRPEVLNSLDTSCYVLLEDKLKEWAKDPEIAVVILTGAGEKAFCAGGDVKTLVLDGQKKGPSVAREFFTREYFVDYLIHSYPKPVLALMDGLTMGGGVGLSVGASHRVVTEKTVVAMPELSIGLFPDVGASHFLHRAPEPLGLFLGLTGARISASDAIYCGLADFYLPSIHKRKLLVDILRLSWATNADQNHKVLTEFLKHSLKESPQPTNAEAFVKITQAMASTKTLGELDEHLMQLKAAEPTDQFLQDALTRFAAGSHLSRKVFFEAYNRHRNLTIGETLSREWDMAIRFSREREFHEGVRAVLIDKDQKPAWGFKSYDDVKNIDQYFSSGEPNLLAAQLKEFRF
jgi:enoyl-CoA hydratase/carnithine racemase